VTSFKPPDKGGVGLEGATGDGDGSAAGGDAEVLPPNRLKPPPLDAGLGLAGSGVGCCTGDGDGEGLLPPKKLKAPAGVDGFVEMVLGGVTGSDAASGFAVLAEMRKRDFMRGQSLEY